MATNPSDFLSRSPDEPRNRPRTDTGNPYAEILAEEEQQRTALFMRQHPQPERVAEANRIARTRGVPATLLDDDLATHRTNENVARTTEVFGRYPAFGRWAAANPRGAAAAQDDYESLGLIGSAFEGLSKIGRRLAAGAFESGAGLLSNDDILDGPLGDIFPVFKIASDLTRGQQMKAADAMRATAALQRKQGRAKNWYADTALSAVESIPITVAAVMTRNPTIAAAIPALSVRGSSLAEGRRQGLSGLKAQTYSILQGGTEFLTEKIPASGLVEALVKKTPIGKTIIRQLGSELPGEQIATVVQDFVDWAMLPENENKAFGDYVAARPGAALQTAIATTTGTVAQTGIAVAADRTARAAVKIADRVGQAQQARQAAVELDRLAKGVSASKTRGRDTEAIRGALQAQADETGATHIHLPGEAAVAYMQSDSYDPDSDPFAAYADQVEEAAASGGDVVIPVADALTDLVDSPAWAALKDDMRLTPGGLSKREADVFDSAMEQVMADLTDEMAEREKGDAQSRTALERLTDSIAAKFGNAGLTAPIARDVATLLATRGKTRAERLGWDITGNEYDALEVRSVMPEAVKPFVTRTEKGVDVSPDLINEVKAKRGPSLLEFVAKRGGISDPGGDLRSMGFAQLKGRAAKGQRKVINDSADAVARVFEAAIEAGYFPDILGTAQERYADLPEPAVFLEALDREYRGSPVYAAGQVTAAADAARTALEQGGYDPAKMSAKDIRDALAQMFEQDQREGLTQDLFDTPDATDPNAKRTEADKTKLRAEAPLRGENRTGKAQDGTMGLGLFDSADQRSLFQGKPIVSITGEEIAPLDTPTSELRKLTRTWYSTNLKGQTVRATALGGRDVRFADSRKAFSASADPRKLRAFAALRELIANGPLIETTTPRDPASEPTVKAYHYLEAAVAVGGQIEIVGVTVREDVNGDIYYNHSMRESAAPGPLDTASKAGPGTEGGAYEQRIAESTDEINMTVKPLGQEYGEGARGRIIFDQNKAIIELFQSRNLSTPLHELSHLWLEELRFDASLDSAPDQIKADWQTVTDWFAANGHPIGENGQIPTEAHELWARSGERYLMEGKAPSTALQRLFDTFRGWLTAIYKTVDKLRAPISPEIREVFDRLIATDEEIAAANERQNLSALFKTAADAAMSAPEFEAYQAQVTQARTEAQGKLLDKTMARVRRARTKEWNDEAATVREQVTADVDAVPLFRALRTMKTDRISEEWLKAEGFDIAALPVRVPPLTKSGGADPEIVAELAGFATAGDMLRTIIEAETAHRAAKEGGDPRSMRARVIEDNTQAEMTRRHGDALNDGTIEREALEAVHNDMQGEVIASELRALSRKTGKRATPYALAKEWARNRIRSGKVVDEASPSAIQRYARAAAKAGREAEAAMLKGDADETFRQKQFQLLNNALVNQAKQAADEVDAAVKRLSNVSRNRKRDSVDQEYWEKAQELLEDYEFVRKTERLLSEQESFEKWAEAKRAAGVEVFVPDRLAPAGTNWTRLTTDQIMALDDTVKSILHLGRRKKEMLDAKDRREFEDWKGEALASLDATPGRKVTTELGDPSRPIAGIFANLMKMEVFAAEMDNDHHGVWTRMLSDRATEAANHRDEQRDRVLNPIAAAYNALPRQTRNRLAERIVVPGLTFRSADLNDPRIGAPLSVTRWEVVGMALNLGTESNFDKLARGFGVDPAQIEQAVMGELTAEEWQFVQTVWDRLETLRPDITRAEREMSGVEPEWVEPREVVTPFGTMRGGYYPVVYDPALSQRAEDNANDAANDMFGGRTGIATAKGHTITRTNYAGPLLLSPERVLFQHVEKVITRNAYAPWVRDVLKAVKDRSIRAAIDRKFGPEFRQQIEPWLRQQVREGMTNENGTRWIEGLLRSARINMSIVAMGLRWSTGVAQTLGLANSAGRIGVNNLRKGFARMLRDPAAAQQFVFERSPEMARRNEAMNREMAEAFREMRKARTTGNAALRQAERVQARVQTAAFWHIGMIDRYMVAMPTWLGAYEKAIVEGMDDADASVAADKAVRLSQGSGREKDLAAWQSNQVSQGLRFFTMFYTPFNVLLNSQWEVGRSARRGDYRKAAVLTFWFMMATPLLDALVAGDAPWDDDDSEEGWTGWLARNIGFYLFAGVPIVRDAANYAERKMIGEFATFSPGPLARAFDAVEKSYQDAADAVTGEDVSDRWLRHAIETPGYFLGLPTGQPAATAQFIWDVNSGEANPETMGDWYWGLTKGKVPEGAN